MLTLLHGEDRYASFERLLALIGEDERSNAGWGVEWFEGALLEPPLETLFNKQGLFGSRRVVIQDFLTLNQPPTQAFILTLIASQDEYIVRERQRVPPPALKGFDQATVEVFPRVTGEALRKRIQALAESFGQTLTPARLTKLANDSNGDLYTAVARLLSVGAEDDLRPDRSIIFRFLRGLVNGETRSLAELRELRASGASDQYLLSMMVWQLRQLFLIVTNEERAVADWQRRALRPALRYWSEARLRAEYFRLVRADHDLKSGELPETLGLDYLVLRLLQPTTTLD